MITISKNPLNPNVINTTGDIKDQVGEYLTSILNCKQDIAIYILNILNVTPYITWKGIMDENLYFTTNITFVKNTSKSPLQQEWWKNINNIRFKKIDNRYWNHCLHNGIDISLAYNLLQGTTKSKKNLFFIKKINKDFISPFLQCKNKKEMQQWFQDNIKYNLEKPKINILAHNIKQFILTIAKSNKETYINYALEELRRVYKHICNSNNDWIHKHKFDMYIDKCIIKYLEIKDKTKINNINKYIKKLNSSHIDNNYNFYTKIKRVGISHMLPYIKNLNPAATIAILDLVNKYKIKDPIYKQDLQYCIIESIESDTVNRNEVEYTIYKHIYNWSINKDKTYNQTKIIKIIKMLQPTMFGNLDFTTNMLINKYKLPNIPEFNAIKKRRIKETI